MFESRTDPFPREACRDLLGLVRALFRATSRSETVRRRKLEYIGRDLKRALELAAAGDDGMAWAIGERATTAMAGVIEPFTMARDVVGAAAKACRRR